MRFKFILLGILVIVSLSVAQTPPGFSGMSGKMQNPGESNAGVPQAGVKHVLYSLILPGAGEWVMGERGMAKFFFGTEFLLWAGYFGTRSYVNVLEDNFHAYAAANAGVDARNKSDQYWIEIGSAENIYKYNEQKRVERRLSDTYPENDFYYWQWESRDARSEYNDLRVKHHDWKRRATFVISGLILNRLVSAIDVVRLLKKQKKSEAKQSSNLYFNYLNDKTSGEVFRLNLNLRW